MSGNATEPGSAAITEDAKLKVCPRTIHQRTLNRYAREQHAHEAAQRDREITVAWLGLGLGR